MAQQSSSSIITLVCLAALAVGAGGCASGSGGDDAGSPSMDATPGDAGDVDAGPPIDAGMTDAGPPEVDAGPTCGDMVCTEFQYCDAGMCRDYSACRGDGTCDRPTDVCHSRRCVPGDVDIDGDGSVAADDCDESDPERYPGRTEECNLVDDDCDEMVDEGDPAMLCESYPGGGICISGSCGCPPGTYDLDRAIAGCECVAMPPINQGLSCATAIDLGSLSDSGMMMPISGNVMPDDRETWYRFRGVDAADTTCDNYHVRVLFTSNPSDTFEFTVFRGNCTTAGCADSGFTDYEWATDFRSTVAGRLSGQCPCTAAAGTAVANVSTCEDDSSNYFVRVRRRAGSMLACDSYTIEVSNGIYDTM